MEGRGNMGRGKGKGGGKYGKRGNVKDGGKGVFVTGWSSLGP